MTTTIQTQPEAEEEAAPTTRPSGVFVLRTALLPPLQPQPYRVHVHERRDMEEPGKPKTASETDITIAGTLQPAESPVHDELRAKLTLAQITIDGRMEGPSPIAMAYNSAADEAGRGNSFLDLMSPVTGAELTLRLTPAGRLREVSGLNLIWQKRGLLMLAPPEFTDMGMTDLLAEALFPPMPGGPIQVGDRFEIQTPADVPNVAQLNAHLKGRLADVRPGRDGLPLAYLEIAGELLPARDILRGAPPWRQPVVRSSWLALAQHVDWNARAMAQAEQRETELALPLGGERTAVVKQVRTLEAVRGNIEPATVPASQPAEQTP